MADSRRTEYEIAMLVGGQVQESFLSSINTVNDSFDKMVSMASTAAKTVETDFGNSIDAVSDGLDKMASASNMAAKASETGFTNSINIANDGFDQMVSMAKTAAKVAAAAFAAVNVGQFVSDAVDTYSTFEQSMANTAATANASALQYEKMEDAAREMGKATTKTAAEAADALGYMALAGWDVDTSIAALEPVLRLSEATQMDLATCSDLVTDSMSALGLSVEELGGYLDICTMANNSANTSAEALMEAFTGCGGTARAVNADLDDTATALGILANNGKKGAEAGTALNAMLVRMTSKDTAIKAMKELGVSAYDASGNFIGLQEVLIETQGALSELNPEEQAAYMSAIAGTNYYTEMSYLLDAVGASADGAGSAWDDLAGKLEDSDGALMRMADTVTDTLGGAFARMDSAMDDAKIGFADAFSDELIDTINGLAGYIPTLTERFIRFTDKAGPKISRTFQAITKGAGEVWDMVSGAGEWVIDNFGLVEKMVAGIGGAIITYKVVSGIAGVAGGVKNLGAAIKAMTITNPWLLAVTAGASAIAGIAAAIKTAEKQAVKSNLAAHFGNIALSMEDISQVAEYISMSGNLSRVQQSLEAFGELQGIQDSMQDSLDAVNKMNWKVSIGMELTEDDRESYIAETQSYVSQVLAYIQQEQYAASLNLGTFAEGDLERQNIVDKLNAFYADKYVELEDLGTKLNKAVSDAFLDGFLDPDEAKEIAELQASMARIQEAMATSDFDAKLKVMELQNSGADLDAESFQALQEELAAQVETAAADYEESLTLRIAQAKVMLDDGAMNQPEYDEAVQSFWEDYLANMADLEAKSLNFQTETIMQAYSSELGPAVEGYLQNMQDVMEKYSGEDMLWQWEEKQGAMWLSMLDDLSDTGLDKTTRKAIEDLLASMQPSIEQVEGLKQKFAEMGVDLPEAFMETITNVEMLNAMAGDGESMFFILGQQMSESEYYADILTMLDEKGGYIPETLAGGIEAGMPETIEPAIDRMYEYSQEYLDEVFSKGLEASVDIRLNAGTGGSMLDTILNGAGKVYKTGSSAQNSDISGYADRGTYKSPHMALAVETDSPGHADGGIFDTPHMAWFAEAGPEAVIPLDGSSNAISLWEKAGQLLGVMDGGITRSRGEELYSGLSGSRSISSNTAMETTDARQYIYSPTIHVEGSTAREGVMEGLGFSFEQFCEYCERLEAERDRVSMIR